MKADIDEKGRLTVQAETPLEAYALAHWAREAFVDLPMPVGFEGEVGMFRGGALLVNVGFEGR